jgi:hypothetical protein
MSEDRNGVEVTINEDWVRMLKTESLIKYWI